MTPHAEHLKCTHHDEGTVVLDTSRGMLSTLNPTGGVIWQALQDGMSREEIVAALVAETGAPIDMVANDVTDFILELEKHALVSRAEGEE